MRVRTVAPLALLLGGIPFSACGNDWSGRWTTYQRTVKVDLATPVRLAADGEALGACDGTGASTLLSEFGSPQG